MTSAWETSHFLYRLDYAVVASRASRYVPLDCGGQTSPTTGVPTIATIGLIVSVVPNSVGALTIVELNL